MSNAAPEEAAPPQQQVNPQDLNMPVLLPMTVETPSGAQLRFDVELNDTVMDMKLFLAQRVQSCSFSCYHLEFQGKPVSDYVKVSQVPELCEAAYAKKAVLKMTMDPYTELAVREHVKQFRQLLVTPPSEMSASAILALHEEPETKNAKPKGPLSDLGLRMQLATLPFRNSLDMNLDLGCLPRTYLGKKVEAAAPEACVHSLVFSAYNPPPGYRRLAGDLMYLNASTLEGKPVHITASDRGFFVNKSTDEQFNPEPAGHGNVYNTLTDLMNKSSSGFKRNFKKLLQPSHAGHVYQHQESRRDASNWTEPLKKPHGQDWNRAEKCILGLNGRDVRGRLRDWNEEVQISRELPRKTLQDRLQRAQDLARTYTEFAQAAAAGTVAVVDGKVHPLNPMDPASSFLYLFNEIFYSTDNDAAGWFTGAGGRAATRKNMSRDLQGVQSLVRIDSPDLQVVPTVVADYLGQRLLSQGVIPGVFHGDKTTKHISGSLDGGVTIVSGVDTDYEEAIKTLATKLHIKPHLVKPRAGKEEKNAAGEQRVHEMYFSPMTKALIGSDRRTYLLDLQRVTPRDANYPEFSAHPTAVLRPEFVKKYARVKALEIAHKIEAERVKKAAEAKKKEGSDGTEDSSEKKGQNEEQLPKKDPFWDAYAAQNFNVDLLTQTNLADGEDARKADMAVLEEAAKMLKDRVIPDFVVRQARAIVYPSSLETLTHEMHVAGINCRYLGLMTTMAASGVQAVVTEDMKEGMEKKKAEMSEEEYKKWNAQLKLSMLRKSCRRAPYFERVCKRAMVVRAAKDVLNYHLTSLRELNSVGVDPQAPNTKAKKHRDTPATVVTNFLNSLVGPHCAGAGFPDELMEKAVPMGEYYLALQDRVFDPSAESASTPLSRPQCKMSDGSQLPVDPLHPATLWLHIRALAKRKFDFEFPLSHPFSARDKLMILRDLAKRCGVVLAGRTYILQNQGKYDPEKVEKSGKKVAIGRIRSTHTPIQTGDVRDLIPRLKKLDLPCHDAQSLYQKATSFLMRGNLKGAHACAHQSLEQYSFVQGVISEPGAKCLELIAKIYMAMRGQFVGTGLETQQRALIIYERVCGADSHQAALAHHTMASYLLAVGKKAAALKHIRRAVYLFEVCAGFDHPWTIGAHINLGFFYMEGLVPGAKREEALHMATKHLLTAFDRIRTGLPVGHPFFPACTRMLAVLAVFKGDFKQAIEFEKLTFMSYSAIAGMKSQAVRVSAHLITRWTEVIDPEAYKQGQARRAALKAKREAEKQQKEGDSEGKTSGAPTTSDGEVDEKALAAALDEAIAGDDSQSGGAAESDSTSKGTDDKTTEKKQVPIPQLRWLSLAKLPDAENDMRQFFTMLESMETAITHKEMTSRHEELMAEQPQWYSFSAGEDEVPEWQPPAEVMKRLYEQNIALVNPQKEDEDNAGSNNNNNNTKRKDKRRRQKQKKGSAEEEAKKVEA